MSLWNLVNVYLFSYYLFAVYYYVFSDKRKYQKKYQSIVQAVLVIIGVYYAKVGSISDIIMYPILSLIYFPFMVAFSSPNFTFLLTYKFRIYEWIKSLFPFNKQIMVTLIQTLVEELVWRSAFIYIFNQFGFTTFQILIAGSLLFYFIHLNLSKKIIILSEIELLVFSFILYLIFISTESIITVWIIHFMRNSYLQFIKNVKIKSA